MPLIENKDPLEPSLDDVSPSQAGSVEGDDYDDLDEYQDQAEPLFSDGEVLEMIRDAAQIARTYVQHHKLSEWETAQKLYGSQHPEGSKYTKESYKNRSKYFKPKTRAAVRKGLVATAAALHSSPGVISVKAGNEADPMQRANAALLAKLLEIRFNSKSPKTGVPWFMVSLAARLQTQVMGAVVSKQSWSYKTKRWTETVWQPAVREDGSPVIDFDGSPIEIEAEVDRVKVIENKPVIDLVPVENVLVSPASNWLDPVQSTPVLIVKSPMLFDDLKAMMELDDGTPWREVEDSKLASALYSDREVSGLQAAREGDGTSRQQDFTRRGPGKHGGANQVIDVWDCYFRVDGEDYQCWTLGDNTILSEPVPTEEAHPALNGQRPYVMGFETIEPFVLYPEAPVISWKPSQDEINDFSNLHMDATRKSIYPTAKVKSGRQIDMKAVQRSDSHGILLVRDENDVTWDRPPGPPPQAFQEVALLSNDFDDLAGAFSAGSVQSNRDLNETATGMKLIAANAGATSELDLRVYVETWAERVVSQVVMLEQYYEDDETLLTVAGQQAKIFQKFGIDQITDDMLSSQVNVTVNVGIGSSDPIQQLTKFKAGMEMLMPFFGIAKEEGGFKLNFEEIFSEILGKAGYPEGAGRFILAEEGQKTVPEAQVKQLMEMLQKAMGEIESLKSGQQVEMMKEQVKLAQADKDRQADLMKTAMQSKTDLQKMMAGFQHDLRKDRVETENNIFEFWNTREPVMPAIPPMGPPFFGR